MNPEGTSSAESQDSRRDITSRFRMTGKLRRRVTSGLVLAVGLGAAGVFASAVAPEPQTAAAELDKAALVEEGKQLYDLACVTCHGINLQGVEDRGPSLVGVGAGATYFQVHSGRMPMMFNEAQAARKTPRYSDEQVLALASFVDAHGGGPGLVKGPDGKIAQGSLRGASGKMTDAEVARGSELYRLNCASCHNFTGQGGALSSGKYAPPLDKASEQEIYQAMITGPQNMPRFSDRQLTPDEKKDIIAYVKASTETQSPGGYDLGGLGPVTEGLAIWLVGIVALVGATLWIGSRS